MTFGVYNAYCTEIDRHLLDLRVAFHKRLTQYRSGGIFREDAADWEYVSLDTQRVYLVPVSAVQRDVESAGRSPLDWAARIREFLEYKPPKAKS